jgi:hypothetical protein
MIFPTFSGVIYRILIESGCLYIACELQGGAVRKLNNAQPYARDM